MVKYSLFTNKKRKKNNTLKLSDDMILKESFRVLLNREITLLKHRYK